MHPHYPERPWTRGPLTITADLLSRIEAHATNTYPDECCGFIFGPLTPFDRLDSHTQAVNEAPPSNAKTNFEINPLHAMQVYTQGNRVGRPLKVIYHSHCNTNARFSATDTANFSHNGQLTWPCAFLIVSVHHGEVVESKLWVHVPGHDRFEEANLAVETQGA